MRRATTDGLFFLGRRNNFYPRSPCGERPRKPSIQIQPLHFYPRSPCGERPMIVHGLLRLISFLSTLSLRRATVNIGQNCGDVRNFYPRSPCGERQISLIRPYANFAFLSTLSLRRATPRWVRSRRLWSAFLSTLSLRRATGAQQSTVVSQSISIHALLAESDPSVMQEIAQQRISIHALLAESDSNIVITSQ